MFEGFFFFTALDYSDWPTSQLGQILKYLKVRSVRYSKGVRI